MPPDAALIYGSGMSAPDQPTRAPSAGGHQTPPSAGGDWKAPWAGGQRPPWAGGDKRPPPVALAVVLALIQVLGSRTAAHHAGAALPPLGYALLIAGPVTLLVRRRWRPVTVVAAVAVTAVYFALGYPAGPGFLAALV